MWQNIQKNAPLFIGCIVAITLCAACTSGAQAEDYRYGYPYRHYYPYDSYGLYDDFGLRQDINRLGKQMKHQQRVLREQVRQQDEQTRLLRQQQSAQDRVTAMQACYYRFNGSLDLCEALFDAASKEYAACVEKVVEMNPGCARDITRPAFRAED